ncbi:MAG: fatty acid desaturase [Chitinophagaceae bacterium]|nr:fatty acid desaturase [Chitinophagaceae bacterium]
MQKEIKPSYRKEEDDRFFRLLRTEANIIVATHSPSRQFEIVFKAILFPSLYFFVLGCIYIWGNNNWVLFSCYCMLGILLVLNYLNIVHDAVHNTIFKSKRLNNAFVYIFDLVGANSFIWRMRHIKFHHNYPNVDGWDTDIDQSKLVRVTPHGEVSGFHKYQHIYMPFLYPFFLFNWLLVRDFKDFFIKKRTVRHLISIPFIEYIKLFVFKAIFILSLVILPKLVLGIHWGRILLAFAVMIFTATFFALLVLLPPHANTGSEFPLPDENKKLPYSWLLHMLKTTNDVTGENWLTRFVLGNYNYHVVHHLFPNIHHTYYPEITRVLQKMAAENDLPYRSYPMLTTLKNHYLLLKQNRSDFDVWEEAM